MTLAEVREEMAALEIRMLLRDPSGRRADQADRGYYLALKASRQHQIDELRFLRRMRHHPGALLDEAAQDWPEKLRCYMRRRERSLIRACLRRLKTACDIGPRELAGEEAP
jgi:hypothetical protein